jgi:VanZ family protein
MLGRASLAVLGTILLLGLWPYQPLSSNGIVGWLESPRIPQGLLPPNQVKWLENGPGLQFGDYGSIFSKEEFVSAGGKRNCSIELWAEPSPRQGYTTVLAFSKTNNPITFQLRQGGDEVVIGGGRRAWSERGLRKKQSFLITLSSDESGTALYLNGALTGKSANVRIVAKDLEGTLVIGDSPKGHETWGAGIVRGLAIYDGQLSAGEAHEHFRKWQAGEMAPSGDGPRMTALYLFTEGIGEVVRSAVPGAPDLIIPKFFRNLRPAFLKPISQEYEADWKYWGDMAENIAAFIPLGLLLGAYLQEVGGKRRVALTTCLGFAVSLTIEVLQYFLPFRNSGTTDLITNTLGTAIGVLLAGTWPVRAALERIKRATRVEGKELPLGGN